MHRRSGKFVPRLLPILLLLAPALTAGAARAEGEPKPQQLRLRLSPGDVQRYALTQNQHMTVDLGPLGKQKFNVTTRLEIGQKVVDVRKDGAYGTELSYDRVAIGLQGMGQIQSYDSANPPDGDVPNALAAAGAIVGRTVGVVISPRGEVLDVEGLEEIWDAVSASQGETLDAKTVEMLRRNFNADTMKSFVQQGLAIFPEAAVGNGDRWSSEIDMSNGVLGTMRVNLNYEAQGRETRDDGECMRVALDSRLRTEGDSPWLEELGKLFATADAPEPTIAFVMDESIGDGSFCVDTTSGLTASATTSSTMGGDVSIETVQNGEPVKMEMRIDVEQQMSLERLGPGDAPAQASETGISSQSKR